MTLDGSPTTRFNVPFLFCAGTAIMTSIEGRLVAAEDGRGVASPGSTRRSAEVVQAVFLNKSIGPLQLKIYHVIVGWAQSMLEERMATSSEIELPNRFVLP